MFLKICCILPNLDVATTSWQGSLVPGIWADIKLIMHQETEYLFSMPKPDRSHSQSPEKMQGNPPALEMNKFGVCSDLEDLESSNFEKSSSPLSNPKASASDCITTSIPIQKSDVLATPPKTPRPRFWPRKGSQKELVVTPILNKIEDKKVQKMSDSEVDPSCVSPSSSFSLSFNCPESPLDVDVPFSPKEAKRLQMLLQASNHEPVAFSLFEFRKIILSVDAGQRYATD